MSSTRIRLLGVPFGVPDSLIQVWEMIGNHALRKVVLLDGSWVRTYVNFLVVPNEELNSIMVVAVFRTTPIPPFSSCKWD